MRSIFSLDNTYDQRSGTTYFAMAVLKSSAPAAARYSGLPSASTPEISLREHSVVRMMKLQVWGTSTSTCAADQTSLLALLFHIQGHDRVVFLFCGNDQSRKTYFAGDFGAALVVRGSIDTINSLGFIVVHILSEVLVSFGHYKYLKHK